MDDAVAKEIVREGAVITAVDKLTNIGEKLFEVFIGRLVATSENVALVDRIDFANALLVKQPENATQRLLVVFVCEG